MKRSIQQCRRRGRLNYRKLVWICGAFVCLLTISIPGAAYCTGSLLWAHPMDSIETKLALSPDGGYLTVGSEDGITVFDANGTFVWTTTFSGECGVAMSAEGRSLAVGGSKLRVFDRNGTLTWKWSNGFFIFDIDIDPDGAWISACMDDCTIREFNLKDGSSWNVSTGEDLYSIGRSKNGQYTVCGSENGHIFLFSPEKRQLWKYRTGGVPISDLAISSDGARIAAFSEDEILYMFSRSGRMLWQKTVGDSNQVAITDDGGSVATGGDIIRVFSGEGDLIWSYETETRVSGVDISADGSILAASDLGHIYLFSLGCPENIVSDSHTEGIDSYNKSHKTDAMTAATPTIPSSPPPKSGANRIPLIAFSIFCLFILKRRK
jgi:WD40 repeat protein